MVEGMIETTAGEVPVRTGLALVALGDVTFPLPMFATMYRTDEGVKVVTARHGANGTYSQVVPSETPVTVVLDRADFPVGTVGVRVCTNLDRHEDGASRTRYLRAHGADGLTAYCDCRKVRTARKKAAVKAWLDAEAEYLAVTAWLEAEAAYLQAQAPKPEPRKRAARRPKVAA